MTVSAEITYYNFLQDRHKDGNNSVISEVILDSRLKIAPQSSAFLDSGGNNVMEKCDKRCDPMTDRSKLRIPLYRRLDALELHSYIIILLRMGLCWLVLLYIVRGNV
jgi:hypothetical protein